MLNSCDSISNKLFEGGENDKTERGKAVIENGTKEWKPRRSFLFLAWPETGRKICKSSLLVGYLCIHKFNIIHSDGGDDKLEVRVGSGGADCVWRWHLMLLWFLEWLWLNHTIHKESHTQQRWFIGKFSDRGRIRINDSSDSIFQIEVRCKKNYVHLEINRLKTLESDYVGEVPSWEMKNWFSNFLPHTQKFFTHKHNNWFKCLPIFILRKVIISTRIYQL